MWQPGSLISHILLTCQVLDPYFKMSDREMLYLLAERAVLTYHSSVYAKTSELNTIYSPSMTITSKIKNDQYDMTFLPKSTHSPFPLIADPAALFKVIVS